MDSRNISCRFKKTDLWVDVQKSGERERSQDNFKAFVLSYGKNKMAIFLYGEVWGEVHICGRQLRTWFGYVKFEMFIKHPRNDVKYAVRYTSLMFRRRATG